MSSPIGHSLLGYTILSNSPFHEKWKGWQIIIFVIAFANFPDVDFLFGYVAGNPNRYHHLWTHSFVFVLGAGGLFGLAYWSMTRTEGLKAGVIAISVMLSHVALDFFTKDTSHPLGVQLIWPVSQKFYISPVIIFRDVSKASSSGAFLESLFCWHNLWTVLMEVILFGSLLILVGSWKRAKKN